MVLHDKTLCVTLYFMFMNKKQQTTECPTYALDCVIKWSDDVV
jgi:hypothetical protein